MEQGGSLGFPTQTVIEWAYRDHYHSRVLSFLFLQVIEGLFVAQVHSNAAWPDSCPLYTWKTCELKNKFKITLCQMCLSFS